MFGEVSKYGKYISNRKSLLQWQTGALFGSFSRKDQKRWFYDSFEGKHESISSDKRVSSSPQKIQESVDYSNLLAQMFPPPPNLIRLGRVWLKLATPYGPSLTTLYGPSRTAPTARARRTALARLAACPTSLVQLPSSTGLGLVHTLLAIQKIGRVPPNNGEPRMHPTLTTRALP